MKEIIVLQEKLALLDRELVTLTEKVGRLETSLKGFADIDKEIKALKIFLGRVHGEFKSDFPEITKKLKD
jgi:hypothetical protein